MTDAIEQQLQEARRAYDDLEERLKKLSEFREYLNSLRAGVPCEIGGLDENVDFRAWQDFAHTIARLHRTGEGQP